MTGELTERELAADWLRTTFATAACDRLPLSLTYDGQPLGEPWRAAWGDGVLTLDEPGGVSLRAEVTAFDDFPAIEWVARLEQTGAADSAIFADIRPLDTSFAITAGAVCRVHHAQGSDCRRDDFAPLCTPLGPTPDAPQAPAVGAGNPFELRSRGGRSSCGVLPFINLELGPDRGVMIALGWTGDWVARCWREGDQVRVQAGMARTHLRLHPGERIRTPRMLLLFWTGDRWRGHNLLRRFLLAHHTPQRHGAPVKPPVSIACWGENRAERQLAKLRWLVDERLPVDNFWVDAGWHGDAEYRDDSTVFNSGWGRHVGNWWPNRTAYPDGLTPIGDAAQAAGRDFTLWFEPERVFEGTRFATEHPEWLLGPIGSNRLLDLGNPAAREALTEVLSQVITEGRVTCYRQDFNTDAAPFWAAADAPDRVGMTELRYVEGLYRLWDDLLARHPDLFIDNCSSGGRRIDLETLSRSIPLWRSDYQCFPDFDPAGMQGQTLGLARWVPLSTGACDRQDDYAFRSTLGPGLVLCTPPNPTGTPEGFQTPWDTFDAAWLRARLAEQQAAAELFLGDFYPLLEYTLSHDQWAAWQLDRPDLGRGLVQAFRRPDSPFAAMTARLHGLVPEAGYALRDADSGEVTRLTGRELTEEGLPIRIAERPGSALAFYHRET